MINTKKPIHVYGKRDNICRDCSWSGSNGRVMVYAHDNQQNYLSDDAVLAPAAKQGAFTSELGMVELNKEEWHEDPYAELAQKIREQNGR